MGAEIRGAICDDQGVGSPRSGSVILGRVSSASATARGVGLAAVVGLLVLLAAAMLGPQVFAGAAAVERVVTATVAEPASCTESDATETVSFIAGGKKRVAQLQACGHDEGETLKVAIPAELPPGELTVRSAETDAGLNGMRRSVGLLLMGLACLGGGFYASILTRSRRPEPVS